METRQTINSRTPNVLAIIKGNYEKGRREEIEKLRSEMERKMKVNTIPQDIQ